MDLEDGSSGSWVDESGSVEKPMNSDEIGLEINGSCLVFDAKQLGDTENCNQLNGSCIGETVIESDGQGKEIDNRSSEIPLGTIGSPSGSSESPKKGFGLKKWRRKKRELVGDGGSPHDSNLGLKRVLSNAEPAKLHTQNLNSENRHGSIGMENSTGKLGVSPMPSSSSPIQISDTEPTFSIGVYFPVGTDSETSEDRSSKFYTLASVPKNRHRGKHNTGKSSGSITHKGSQGKGVTDTIKKHRGENINANHGKIEKGIVLGSHIEDEVFSRIEDDSNNLGNSYSSVESNLRSSVGTVNGRQVEAERHSWSSNYDEEAQIGDDQDDYYNENGVEVEDGLGENDNRDMLGSMHEIGFGCRKEKEEEVCGQPESENHQPRTEQDPLVESLIQLQAAQIALEKEIQKFGEIGKGPILQFTDSNHGPSSHYKFDGDNSTIQVPNLFRSHSEGMERTSFPPVEIEIIKLRQQVNLLEHELEEASNTARSKEAKALEIETILNKTYLPEVQKRCENIQPLPENYKELDIEFECLFKEKVEAEIECLIITRATQNLDVLIKNLVIDQGQMVMKLKEAENMALLLKSQAEELEIACQELLGIEEVLKMNSKVSKYSLFFIIQFILLCIAIGLFLFQLSPQSPGVVPT